MNESAIPPTLVDAARLLFIATVSIYEEAEHPQAIKALLERCSGLEGSPVGLRIMRSYADIVEKPEKSSGYWSLFLSGRLMKRVIEEVFTLHQPKTDSEPSGTKEGLSTEEKTVIGRGPLVLDAQDRLSVRLRDWLALARDYERLWLDWSRGVDKARAAARATLLSVESVSKEALIPARVLADDQQAACEHLLALANTRRQVSLATIPASILGRWSVPLLVGPAGSGKTYVCQELARRLDRLPCRRWDIGSWVITANRSTHTTLEQIQAFVEANLQGCVVYLAGVDALCIDAAHNASYFLWVANEVERLLDQASERPVRFVRCDGTVFGTRAFVILGGQFPGLWGDAAIGGFTGAEAWRLADREPLADTQAVSAWLVQYANLPASILRRLAAPLALRPLCRDEAGRLAARFQKNLPASLDGIGVEELAAALRGPLGWRGVYGVIEQALTSGQELPPPPPSQPEMRAIDAKPPVSPRSLGIRPPKPKRLGHLLGLGTNRTRVIVKAGRLGLSDSMNLENLAAVRGYVLAKKLPDMTLLSSRIGRDEFSDLELAVALLSPCWEWQRETILRGALVLRGVLTSCSPAQIAAEARQARTERLVRHIALLAETFPQPHTLWRALLTVLPAVSPEHPALKPGIMPDEAIKRVLVARDG